MSFFITLSKGNMGSKARNYTRVTLKKLHILSGNQCAAPDCTSPLIAQDGETIISKICHIEAASEDGPRFNPGMTDDERRHFNNLVLLCDEHHCIVDNKANEGKFTVPILKEWKLNHEAKLSNFKLRTRVSLLKTAIDAISNIDFETEPEKVKTSAFNIDDKIKHNEIKRNKSLIDEYKIYYSKLNELYKELEIQGSFKKEKLLRNIRTIYLKIKGKYVGDSMHPLGKIRENADSIIEDVESALIEAIENDSTRYEEDVVFGISVIMVDAFMRCKILEEPPR